MRFSRKSDKLAPAEKARVEEVVIRRLKREINERRSRTRGSAIGTCARVPLFCTRPSRRLSAAFEAFRAKVRHARRARESAASRLPVRFAVEVLGKRLLVLPGHVRRFVVALSRRHARRLPTADAAEVRAAERAVREDTADDRETESRTAHAARTVGAWLKPLAERSRATRSLRSRGADAARARPAGNGTRTRRTSRFEALLQLIDDHLRDERRRGETTSARHLHRVQDDPRLPAAPADASAISEPECDPGALRQHGSAVAARRRSRRPSTIPPAAFACSSRPMPRRKA